jgi:hypothetical protein
VAYEREAWLSHAHNNVRVTFDRNVRCEPVSGVHLTTAFRAATTVFDRVVVLELKFTDRYPRWLHDMVCALNLTPASAAKYVDGVNRLGREAFAPAAARPHRLVGKPASVRERKSHRQTTSLARPLFA